MRKIIIFLIVLFTFVCVLHVQYVKADDRCNQPVELENCYDYSRRLYPIYIGSPRKGECGQDTLKDKIIEYQLPYVCYSDPGRFRIGSDLWWLNYAIKLRYGGSLSANGLCSDTIRICAGSTIASFDLNYIYLWYKWQ